MLLVGIYAPESDNTTEKIIHAIVKKRGLKYVNLKCERIVSIKEELESLREVEVDFVVVILANNQIIDYISKEIMFDFFIYDNTNKKQNISRNILKTIHTNSIIITNADDDSIFDISFNSKIYVVTYGLSLKATITASSIINSNDSVELTYCIQRRMVSINEKIYDIEEFKVKLQGKNISVYNTLPSITLALLTDIYDKDTDDIIKI